MLQFVQCSAAPSNSRLFPEKVYYLTPPPLPGGATESRQRQHGQLENPHNIHRKELSNMFTIPKKTHHYIIHVRGVSGVPITNSMLRKFGYAMHHEFDYNE